MKRKTTIAAAWRIKPAENSAHIHLCIYIPLKVKGSRLHTLPPCTCLYRIANRRYCAFPLCHLIDTCPASFFHSLSLSLVELPFNLLARAARVYNRRVYIYAVDILFYVGQTPILPALSPVRFCIHIHIQTTRIHWTAG